MADPTTAFAERINEESFREWYRERQWAENIRDGRPYFNGPSPVPPADKHSPSSLLQCHRKILYRQENAPAERERPEGIFWTGRRFETDVIRPYLQHIAGDDAYVRNSIWVEFDVETDVGALRVKGTTDPCLVDRQSTPLLPTEVKTKAEVDHLEAPDRHHRAQVHAYMRGLSAEYDCTVTEAVVIYGSRETLTVRAFPVAFDPEFWQDVVAWAADHTAYRRRDELPPADPEYGWECRYCDYRHRCGRSDRPYDDEPPDGFLPLFADYPRERVVAYLRARDDARLTPTLAREYPDLAETYDVADWICPRCDRAFPWDSDRLAESTSDRPVCPGCAGDGDLSVLSPAMQAE